MTSEIQWMIKIEFCIQTFKCCILCKITLIDLFVVVEIDLISMLSEIVV